MTRGTATAETLILSSLQDVGDMSKLTVECRGERCDRPAMPEILMLCEDLGREPESGAQI